MNARLNNRSRSTLVTPDFITVRGGSPVTSIVQAPEAWLETSGHADATFMLEVAEVTAPPGGLVLIQVETSPTADESLFLPIAGPNVAAVSATPTIMKTASAVGLPIARFIRWKVLATTSGSFDVTFRLRMTCNRQTYFTPATLVQSPPAFYWFRADRGLTVNGTTVTKWTNQVALTDSHRTLTAGNAAGSANNPTINPIDTNYNNQQTLGFSANAGCFFSCSGFMAPPPTTWIIVGHRTNGNQVNYAIDGNSGMPMSDQSIFGAAPAGGSPITVNAGNALTLANTWTTRAAVLIEVSGPMGNIFFNNFTTAGASGNDGTNMINGLTVGGKDPNAGGGNLWLGTLAEIIGYQGTLTAAQKSLLRTYLNNRYALGIT